MNKKAPIEVRAIIPFVDWLDRHPAAHKAMLILLGAAIAVVAFFYDFTTI